MQIDDLIERQIQHRFDAHCRVLPISPTVSSTGCACA
jgi:hypothetical protein